MVSDGDWSLLEVASQIGILRKGKIFSIKMGQAHFCEIIFFTVGQRDRLQFSSDQIHDEVGATNCLP